ncbi:MAG TPA: MBL fold metallo-hydrolase [Acidisphaera sp.]|nr:MBL fold metallo-hydrolase [Acidisphaera sp.]
MDTLRVGDVTITSIVERDGPWRSPAAMFPAYDAERGRQYLSEMPQYVFDEASGLLVIRYQTFVVRTPRHTMLVDTCTGEDKGYGPPMDFPKQPWLEGFRAAGLRFDDIDYVFCTHLHIDHSGWNTKLVDGRWVPSFPRAKYVFHRREYEAWEAADARGDERPGGAGGVWRMNCRPVVEAGQALLVDDDFTLDDTVWLTPTPGHSPCHCCVNITSGGQRAVVTGDMMHHALQCREPAWSTVFDWDPAQAERSRRSFLASVAGTDTLLLPIHFPGPTAGHVTADGEAFRYRFLGEPA